MVRIYAIILNSDRLIGKLLDEDIPIPFPILFGAPGPWAQSWGEVARRVGMGVAGARRGVR